MLITAFAILFLFAAVFRPLRQGFYAAHVLTVLLAVLAYNAWDWQAGAPFSADVLWIVGILHLLCINLWTFAAYGYDKKAAIKGKRRIPEKSLHAMAFIGGTIGAFAGSRVFRHKTKKARFRALFWLLTVLQLLLVILFRTISQA